MMKKICKLLFAFVILFCFCIDVDAANLNMKDITLECIYSDGGLYTSAFSGIDEETSQETYMVNRTAYNLVGVNSNSANKGSASHVVNNMFVDNKCQEELYTMTANLTVSENDEGENEVEINDDEETTFYKFGAPLLNTDAFKIDNNWYLYGKYSSWLEFVGIDISSTLDYNLVSERYILGSDVPEPNATIYYKQEAKQVAGKASFVSIMVYDNAILMKKNDRVTRLNGDYSIYQGITKNDDDVLSKEVPEKIYINNPEPEAVSNSSANVAYKFLANQKVFSVSKTKDSVHVQEYLLTDEVPDDDGDRSSALCDEILVNTSPYLKTAIKAMQVLVPLFLVVLTAFDIGKIVLTGNIEEELPKRKKIIIVRFVVAIVFFFLPSFISLFTTWLIDSGAKNVDSIEYIDCLFK